MNIVVAGGLFLVAAITAALFVVWPLWRSGRRDGSTPAAVDVEARRTRVRELAEERDAGLIDEGAYSEARAEAERELLEALESESARSENHAPRQSRAGVLAAAVAVPVLAAMVYVVSGRPGLILGVPQAPPASANRAVEMQRIKQGLPELRQRVIDEPGNIQAWGMLANAYLALERPQQALDATKRALQANNDVPTLLVARARALAAVNDGRFGKQARGALDRTLQQAPSHLAALWLRGAAAAQRGNWAVSREHWRRLRETLPAGEASQRVKQALAALPGGNTESAPGADSSTPISTGLRVQVALAPDLRINAPPETTVFVFAKSPQGGGMPLAAARTTLGELPGTVTLDAAMGQASGRRIKPGDPLQITARVSRSGGIQAKEGDWQGTQRITRADSEAPPQVTVDRQL